VPSLNLDLDYFDHPKTKRLIGLLGRGAEVLPIRLWCYCGKYHRRDGSLTDYSPQEIETIVGWWGQKGEAIEAMVRVGLLDMSRENTFRVHDWKQHAGHLEKYSKAAKVGSKARWDRYKAAIRTANEPVSGSDPNRNPPARQGKALHKEPPLSPGAGSKARPRDLDEVRAYWLEDNLTGDPEAWWDHCLTVGWVVGKARTPIRDWRSACRTWSRNETKYAAERDAARRSSGGNGTGRRPTPPTVGANHPDLTPEERAVVDELRRQEDESRRSRLGVAS